MYIEAFANVFASPTPLVALQLLHGCRRSDMYATFLIYWLLGTKEGQPHSITLSPNPTFDNIIGIRSC